MIERVYVGLPIWNRADWTGELFPSGTPAGQRLATYARFFNAVEGNTTFYAVPPASTVQRWADQTPADFRFCFKFPRTITHDRLLVNAAREAEAFIRRLEILGPRVGPVMVQLPARFGPQRLPLLEDFLMTLPSTVGYAVEVRHPAYFEGTIESELNQMLSELGIDRVILDTRGIYEAQHDHQTLAEARRKKPQLPVPIIATAHAPVLRYIADPRLEDNDQRLCAWAQQITTWLDEGRQPFAFMHVPNDLYAPQLARMFFERLSGCTPVGVLPQWVGECRQPHQARLFDEGNSNE